MLSYEQKTFSNKRPHSIPILTRNNQMVQHRRIILFPTSKSKNRIKRPNPKSRPLARPLSSRTSKIEPSFCKQYNACQFYCLKIISYVFYKGISGVYFIATRLLRFVLVRLLHSTSLFHSFLARGLLLGRNLLLFLQLFAISVGRCRFCTVL